MNFEGVILASAKLVLIAFFISTQSGCFSKNIQPASQKQGSQTKIPNEPHASSITDEEGLFKNDIRKLLREDEIESLETVAKRLRASKERFPGGAWKLRRLYDALEAPLGGGEDSEENWKVHLERLKRWARLRPRSITAPVALAEAFSEYAMKARGWGFTDSVSAEGWRLMKERVNQAEQVLNEARNLVTRCPQWYECMQHVALMQGWDRDRYNKLFEEAVTFEPLYPHFYTNKALYLLQRWYGEAGEWEKFAAEVSAKIGGKEGSALFSYVILSNFKYYEWQTFFSETRISWLKLKQGFLDREELYGSNAHSLNGFCALACVAGDKLVAQELFQRIGDQWDAEIGQEESNFEKFKNWAFN